MIGIVGFGSAARKIFFDNTEINNIMSLQKKFEKLIKSKLPNIKIFGEDVPRLPNTTCVYMPHMNADAQVIAMDLEGFSVSAGSACSSGKVKSSHVLEAMGAKWASNKSIRISSGWQNTKNDLEKLAQFYVELYKRTESKEKEIINA